VPSGAADPVDLLLDLALADDFETQVATVMRNGDDDEVARLVAHPAAMIGASDAGAHVLANTDSCYAVWTLQHWVRERKVLSLERAVAMLTGDQARLLGLADRGLVRRASPPTSCCSTPTGSPRPGCASSTTNRPGAVAWSPRPRASR
jgi:N-acyl-D-amino-acid deacylase